MSSCSTEVCGVGGWGGPKPGDPDNNVVLSAVPAYGGIDVSWTYPATNPFAVAHTLLYRGSSSNFSSAVQHAVVAGSFFYDKIDANVRYYYWIQLVSVNGTVGELVGPATALAKPTIEKIIEDITGRIDDGALAGSLRGEIGKIALNYSELLDEIAARIAGNAAFSAALQDLRDGLIDSLALIHEEVITRTNGQDALAALVTTLAAANANTAALLESTRLVLVSADAALSLRIDSVNAALGALGSAVTNVEAAKIGYSVLSGTDTPFDGNQIHIVYPADAYPAAEYPHYAVNRYRIIDKVGVDLWNANPVTASTPLQWLVGLPLATAVKKVGVSGPDGGYASLENAFVAQQGLNGQFKAMYTVKLNVNGLVGGFGIYNTGATVEAGFDVDTFWVGRTQANKRKPFIVEGGTVYIDDAAINKLTFSKLRDEGGNFVVEGGKLKASYISADSLSAISANLGTINSGSISLTGSGNPAIPWGYIRSGTKSWDDGSDGWALGKAASTGETVFEVKAGTNRIWFSTWGDCGIRFPGFEALTSGLTVTALNVIGTGQIKPNSISDGAGADSINNYPSVNLTVSAPCKVYVNCVISYPEQGSTWGTPIARFKCVETGQVFGTLIVANTTIYTDSPEGGSYTHKATAQGIGVLSFGGTGSCTIICTGSDGTPGGAITGLKGTMMAQLLMK